MTRLNRTSARLLLIALYARIVSAANPSHGCQFAAALAGEVESNEPVEYQTGDITVQDRIVRLSVPTNVLQSTKPRPLIIAYHDDDMTAEDMEAVTGLSLRNSDDDYIVAYPQSRDREAESTSSPTSDFDFASSMLDHLTSTLCIDADRIYATGLGTGAGFVNLLACHPTISSRFTAYAMVNGALTPPDPSAIDMNHPDATLWTECNPARNFTRILSIHGQDNEAHPYFAVQKPLPTDDVPAEESENDVPSHSIVTWLVEWAIRNNCGSSFARPALLSEPHPWSGSHMTRLQRGSLIEGYDSPNHESVIRAAYRCWAKSETEIAGVAEKLVRKYDGLANIVPYGDIKKHEHEMERWVIQRIDEIIARATEKLDALQQRKEGDEGAMSEQEIRETLEFAEKGVDVVVHYAVQDAGHGWLRLQRGCDDQEGWRPLTDDEGNASSAVDQECTPDVFDSTATVLDWFLPLSKADTQPVSEPEEVNTEEMMQSLDEDQVGELLKYMGEHIRVKDKMEEHLNGQIGVEDRSSKERKEDRIKVREKFAELQRKKNEEYEAAKRQEEEQKSNNEQVVRDEL